MSDKKRDSLNVWDGLWFGIGFTIAPLVVAIFAFFAIATMGGCGGLLSLLGD